MDLRSDRIAGNTPHLPAVGWGTRIGAGLVVDTGIVSNWNGRMAWARYGEASSAVSCRSERRSTRWMQREAQWAEAR